MHANAKKGLLWSILIKTKFANYRDSKTFKTSRELLAADGRRETRVQIFSGKVGKLELIRIIKGERCSHT